jgi:hypothetical protein
MYLYSKLLLKWSKFLCIFTKTMSLMHNYIISLERIVIGFSTSISVISLPVTFLSNQLMIDIEGLLYIINVFTVNQLYTTDKKCLISGSE